MAMFTIVSKNIDFLRWKYGTHEALSERLKDVVGWNELSAFANASAVPSAAVMQGVESSLKLPPGWGSRDNLVFTELSPQDYELATLAVSCKPSIKTSLVALLTAVRDGV